MTTYEPKVSWQSNEQCIFVYDYSHTQGDWEGGAGRETLLNTEQDHVQCSVMVSIVSDRVIATGILTYRFSEEVS